MPEVNQISNLLPQSVAAQLPLNIRQEMLAGQLAQQQAAAPTGPYTSRTAGMLKALEGGLGGLMEGSAVNRAMQGQRQSVQQMLAMADAMQQMRGGAPAAGGAAAPGAPSRFGSDAVASGAASNPAGYDPKSTEALIRARAPAFGIDPDAAVNVARHEGLNVYHGDSGSSFGPFQLHYGNVAGGGNAVGGMGDDFTKATGLDARDPSTVPQQIDFALGQAAKGGWGPWHGAQAARMGNWDGIGQAPRTAAGQLAATPGSTQAPPPGIGDRDPGLTADMPAPGAKPVASNTLPPGITPDMVSGGQAPAPVDLSAGLAGSDPTSAPAPTPTAPPPAPTPSRSDLLANALDAMSGPASAGPAVVPLPQAASDPVPPPPPAPDPIAAAQMQGRDVAMDPVVPDPQGSLVPPAPSSSNGALQGPQNDAAMGNGAPAPEPSLRDTIMAAMNGGAPSAAPAAPPTPAPSGAPADLSAGLAGSDPTGGGVSGGPTMPSLGPSPAAAAPAGPAPASQPQPPGAGGSLPPLPSFLGPDVPRSQMLAAMLDGQGSVSGPAPSPPRPAPAGQSLPQTGPMPPQGDQSASPGSPLGVNPDAPAPGAQAAGPAPLPASMAPPPSPQPLGLPGNSALSDPSSPQSFQRQQMLAAALGGGSGGPPTASAAPPPAQPTPGGLMASLGGMGGGSPAPASPPPAGASASPPSGNYAQVRALAGQILANPYANPGVQEMALKMLMPQMQTITGADGKLYGFDPMTRQATLLADIGAKFTPNESLYQGGKFTQAPAAPMDVAPGNSVISFGANNQAVPQVRTAPTPEFEPIPNTPFAMDKRSGQTVQGPPGMGSTDAKLDAGNGVAVPQRVTPNPQGGAAVTPLVPAGAPGGGPLGGAQPLVDQAAKNAASAAALKEGATGQVQGAQKFVDETAKNAAAAATHVQELQQLKGLSAAAPSGWNADLARFTSSHGLVGSNGDAVQSYDGLRSYLGTQLRQAGSGALRNSEMDKLSNALGSTDSSPAARAAAIQRIQDGFARQAALGQVASDPSAPDPLAKQSRIQGIAATWQNADAAIEAHPDKRAAIIAKMQASGIPVVGF